MTWLVVLLIFSPLPSYSENICDLTFCECEDSVAQCSGNNQENLVLSPSSLPLDLTSLSLSHLESLHIQTNTFQPHVDLLTLILDNITRIHLDPFIFSETEYDGFLRTFEINNVIDLSLKENSFDNAPQCGNSTFRNISIKVQRRFN